VHDAAGGVLLGGDHQERAAVELAGARGTLDELPQPRERRLRVAVPAVVDPSLPRVPSLRVLVMSVRSSSTTSRTPPVAIRPIRSPVWEYGEPSPSPPRA
jgi:hypothetical protein